MPLYEYECSTCGHVFEVIRKFSDPPEDKCPKCGGPVHKRQSAPAFQFKGTGWYVTDYAKSGQTESKTNTEGKQDKSTEAPSKTDSSSSGSTSAPTTSSNAPAASKTASSKTTDS